MTDTPNPAPQDPINPGNTPAPEPTPGEQIPDPADVEKNKIMGVLAYLGILVLVPLLAAKDSKFARYHANQGLILLIASFGLSIALTCPMVILGFIAVKLPFLMCCLWIIPMAAGLSVIVLTIMGIINAINGQMKPLPVIGKYTIIK